jgi:hypothetical protein
MGIGRSSIIAGSILLLKGEAPNAIIQEISSIRGLKVPDTEEQITWLRINIGGYPKSIKLNTECAETDS